MKEPIMTQAQAEIAANDIIRPYFGQVSVDAIEGLIVRIAGCLRYETYKAYQRGLDTVPMGGSHRKHIKVTVQ